MADAKTKKVRVLTRINHEGADIEHNAVIELTDAQIKHHGGSVDADPDAIAYAEAVNAEAAKKKK